MKNGNTFFLKKVALFIRTYLKSNSLENCEYLKYNNQTNKFDIIEDTEASSKYIARDIFRILKRLRDEKIKYIDKIGDELETFINSHESISLEEVAATTAFDGDLTDVDVISQIYNEISVGFSDAQSTEEQTFDSNVMKNSVKNHIDNVVMLQSIYSMLDKELKKGSSDKNQMQLSIKEKLFDIVLDLANADNSKYTLVKNPVYQRKIHNGERFNSPLMLFYWLCRLQWDFKVLNKQEEVVLRRILKSSYERLGELKSYEIGLLLASTPTGYEKEVKTAKEELFNRTQEDGSWGAEEVILQDPEAMIFLGSKLYTTVICVEGLCTGGIKSFGTFEDAKIKPTFRNSHISREVSIDKDRFMDFKNNKIYMTIEDDYMKPVLEKNDEIKIELSTEAEKDDIVVFVNQRGELLAHRVTEIIENQDEVVFITCTEDKSEFGYPVFKRNTIGRVTNVNKFSD